LLIVKQVQFLGNSFKKSIRKTEWFNPKKANKKRQQQKKGSIVVVSCLLLFIGCRLLRA
jgi:hypothetical protein